MPHELMQRQRRMRRSMPRGRGQFRQVGSPQAPVAAISSQLRDSMASEPGIRMAKQTGRRTYTGGGVPEPQRFTRPPSELNEANDIRAATIHAHNVRRHLGRRSALPGVL